MSDFQKNAVKLLPNIYNSENNVVFYTQFDGFFEVGDKLYIMVNTNDSEFSTEYYQLDSYYNSGSTQAKNGYTLLKKEGNKLTLDINYEELYSVVTTLTVDCYIGRVYTKNATISNATINGVMLHNTNFIVSNTLNLKWKQGIIFKVSGSTDTIQNVNFRDKYTSDFLILKSEIDVNGNVESYYTLNNYNIGLTVVNLIEPIITLYNCDIYSGTFQSCKILSGNSGVTNYIYGGKLIDCDLGNLDNLTTTDKITVNGGYLYNCKSTDSIFAVMNWLDGKWYNDLSGNTFNFKEWTNGTWENGIFPQIVWLNGRFMNGKFNGDTWYDGVFNNGIFNSVSWYNGYFNGGLFSGINWFNGTFNSGSISGSTWINGILNGGEMSYCNWVNGIVNYGDVLNTHWSGGTFNDGKMSGCTWYNGIWKGGLFDQKSNWYNGTFHGGTFNNSYWYNGKFYNGTIFNSEWHNGQMFFGTCTKLIWSGGTWYDGIANIIDFYGGDWYNGVFNDGTFYGGNWYDGSFNGGYFSTTSIVEKPIWHNGIFYNGEFYGTWISGTFYTGTFDPPGEVPSRDYIGKEFVPYNKNGMVTKSKVIPRIPKISSVVPSTVKDAKVTVIPNKQVPSTTNNVSNTPTPSTTFIRKIRRN